MINAQFKRSLKNVNKNEASTIAFYLLVFFLQGILSRGNSAVVFFPVFNQHTCSAVSLALFLSWSLFELHLAEVQHGARAAVQAHLFFLRETENSETVLCTLCTKY